MNSARTKEKGRRIREASVGSISTDQAAAKSTETVGLPIAIAFHRQPSAESTCRRASNRIVRPFSHDGVRQARPNLGALRISGRGSPIIVEVHVVSQNAHPGARHRRRAGRWWAARVGRASLRAVASPMTRVSRYLTARERIGAVASYQIDTRWTKTVLPSSSRAVWSKHPDARSVVHQSRRRRFLRGGKFAKPAKCVRQLHMPRRPAFRFKQPRTSDDDGNAPRATGRDVQSIQLYRNSIPRGASSGRLVAIE